MDVSNCSWWNFSQNLANKAQLGHSYEYGIVCNILLMKMMILSLVNFVEQLNDPVSFIT